MKRLGFLPLLLLAWPIAEIAALIFVGQRIGILSTILLLVGMGVAGVILVRFQGLRLLTAVRADLQAGRVPAQKMVHGALIAVAGFLFLLPGFLTDILALALLIPPVRSLIALGLLSRMTIRTTRAGGAKAGVVDLDPEDYRRADSHRAVPPRLEP